MELGKIRILKTWMKRYGWIKLGDQNFSWVFFIFLVPVSVPFDLHVQSLFRVSLEGQVEVGKWNPKVVPRFAVCSCDVRCCFYEHGPKEYHNVRSIFLECNGISKIENLEVMPQLVSLYLQSNCITRMENLALLSNLQYLNLSHNSISEVQNLATLSMLDTLNLAANKFEDVEKLKGLSERPTLRSVDVSANYFEDGDALVGFWEANLPNVQCLYIHHNPCSRLGLVTKMDEMV